MMRRILSLFLVSLFVIQPASVFAQTSEASRTLQEILADMPQEVSRLSRSHLLEVVTTLDGEAESQTNQEESPDRIREKVLATPIGTTVTVTLSNGEVVRGELAEATESYFYLRLLAPEEKRHLYGADATTREKFDFEEVSNFQTGSRVFLTMIPLGKVVELRLFSGEKFRGRLRSVSEDGVTVDEREFAFDQIISAKTAMSRTTKVYIILGITIPLLVLFGYAAFAAGA
jgi:small nuclear ribonucleoprotein (snRNP)-like protein